MLPRDRGRTASIAEPPFSPPPPQFGTSEKMEVRLLWRGEGEQGSRHGKFAGRSLHASLEK